MNRMVPRVHAPQSSACQSHPDGGLDLVVLTVRLLFFLQDFTAPPARIITRRQLRSASTIAIVIKTLSVGHTHSIGIASQYFVGQMMRIDLFPRVPMITWICRPVIISPQTKQ